MATELAAGGPAQSRKHEHKKSTSEKLKHPIREIREKLANSSLNEHLHHEKNKIGKFKNLINPQHRHDEAHEKACDDKRTNICLSHRFESFFPERDGNNIKWYVDGRDYFWAVSVALEKAKETIYLADWWLSPELFLRRPPAYNQEWRLDQVLKRRAEAGVKIYVIVYREVEAALTCNSAHTKHALQALCPEGSPGHGNITIMRHPDHNVLENVADMTFYWAHHEKFIVIDYEMAFIGGLDLCFGRWDYRQHSLADMHPEGVANEIWPGQDFNNNRVMDFKNVQDWKQNELTKAEHGRMPWHDVAMGVVGPTVYDIAEHFVLRWNFIKRDKYKRDKRYDWIELQGRQGQDEDLVGVQRPKFPVGKYVVHPLTPLTSKPIVDRGTVHAQIVRSSADWSSGILTEHSIQNAYSDIIRNAQHYVYIENQFFITATGDQQSPIHNTIGRSIVDAVVRAAKEGRKFRIIIIIPAIPGFAGDLRDNAALGTRAIMDYQYKSICRGEHSIFEQIRKEGVDPNQHIFFFNLRSYDRLNRTAAEKKMEKEAGLPYQELQRAQAEEVMGEGIHGTSDPQGGRDSHMGSRRDQKGTTQESEGQKHSRDTKKKFEEARTKVEKEGTGGIENMSAYANADGELEGNINGGHFTGSNTNASSENQTKTDTNSPPRGKEYTRAQSSFTVAHHAMARTGSIAQVKWDGDPEDEINNWIQEELYVHAKLLIADDRIVVCGSSNLNDRSQLGYHDSELSIVMEDKKTVQTTMDGQPYEAGWHATSLRRYLWREHLGLLPPQDLDASDDPNAQPPGDDSPNDVWECDESWKQVEDPLSDELWEMWASRATKNTEVFRHLFHADPDDHVKTFDDYNAFLPAKGVKPGHIFDRFMPPTDARKKLEQVKGHLVWMPLDFLKDADMAERGLQVNSWTESVYT
ncbi:hypothetical protein QBC32DRAFT_330399 [Pseudoneurospora amorphoporcata]|uniref:Phospholipase n=1 Tax=Pseudoneurospora amorphoporcata TaxID=241081 RepID=A0AAN6SKD1_9PEZI|nr:hypothetical protein QBC32DRAFT_330399 [Pseudoneurospora amorphoporcata]